MSAPVAGEDTAGASNDGDEPWTTVSGRNSRRSSRDGRPRVGKHNVNPPLHVRVSPVTQTSSGAVRSEDEDADGEEGEIIDDAGNDEEDDEEDAGGAANQVTATTTVRQSKKWVDATSENAYDVIAPPRTPTRPEKKKETAASVDDDDADVDADGSGTEEGSASKPGKPAVNERRRAKRRARRRR